MPLMFYTTDPEWGERLVGLRMVVPLSWWPGYSGDDICLEKITNFNPSASPPFFRKIDNKPGNFYGTQ